MRYILSASMQRLIKSDFFHEVEGLVQAWDYFLGTGDEERAAELMHKWKIAKLALKHITGNYYRFSRDGTGNYSVVDEINHSDRIISGFNEYRNAKEEQAVKDGVKRRAV